MLAVFPVCPVSFLRVLCVSVVRIFCPCASAVNGYGEMDSLARVVNPVEGEDEKNGAKQSEQQVG